MWETHGSPRKMTQQEWWNFPHLTLFYRSVAIKHMVICWNFGAADMAHLRTYGKVVPPPVCLLVYNPLSIYFLLTMKPRFGRYEAT